MSLFIERKYTSKQHLLQLNNANPQRFYMKFSIQETLTPFQYCFGPIYLYWFI